MTTFNLYLRLIGFILLFCGITPAHATEFSTLLGLGQENFGFTVESFGLGDQNIAFEPNMAGLSRLGLSYGDYSVGTSFRSSSAELNPEKGKTTFFDIQLGYHNRKWGVDTFYQTYTGFFIANTNLIQVYPDLKFQHYGIMARYALNDSDFSVASLMDQSDEIKKSAGKYYLVSGLRQHIMETSTSLLQAENAGMNTELENLRKMKVFSYNAGIGAGKYWVSDNHFFIGAVLDLIGTLGFYDFEDTTQVKEKTSYGTLSYNAKVGFGYAGQTFRAGASLAADLTTLRTPGKAYIKPTAQRTLFYLRIVY